jgi:hypothetical protein
MAAKISYVARTLLVCGLMGGACHAQAFVLTISDQASCESLPVPASWGVFGPLNSCRVEGDLIIGAADHLTIDDARFRFSVGKTLTVRGRLTLLRDGAAFLLVDGGNLFVEPGGIIDGGGSVRVSADATASISNGATVRSSRGITVERSTLVNAGDILIELPPVPTTGPRMTCGVGCDLHNLGQLLSYGKLIVEGDFLNDGLLVNYGEATVDGLITNAGTTINSGLINVDCGRFDNQGTTLGSPLQLAYCWAGFGDSLWSDVGNWHVNGVNPATPPGEASKIFIREFKRPHLDVDFDMRGTLEIDEGRLTVDPFAVLTTYGNLNIEGEDGELVNDGVTINFGQIFNTASIINNADFFNHATITSTLSEGFDSIVPPESSIVNRGEYQNAHGALTRQGLDNRPGGLIINGGTWQIDPRFTPTNAGTISNVGAGQFEVWGTLAIENGGVFANGAYLAINSSPRRLPGAVSIGRGSTLINRSLMEITSPSSWLSNWGTVENIGIIGNGGEIRNEELLCGPGSITGNPVIGNPPRLSCDVTPPVITVTVSGTRGGSGWYTSNVSVSWSVTDPESAVESQIGCGARVISQDTEGLQITCTATSAGGTRNRSVFIRRDATAPILSAAVAPNPVLQHLEAIATPTASDPQPGSGVDVATCAAVGTTVVGDHVVSCQASDVAGNLATFDAAYTVLSPAEASEQIGENVEDLNLPGNTAKSLLSSLRNVVKSLDKDNKKAALGMLRAFINQVEAQMGKKISTEDGQALIDAALLIIDSINGG